MSDQQSRARAPTLQGFSVKSKLEYWKQKDAENQRSLSQESRGSGRSSIDASGSPFGRTLRFDSPQTTAYSPPPPASTLPRVDTLKGRTASTSSALSPLAVAASPNPFDGDGDVHEYQSVDESDETAGVRYDLTDPKLDTANDIDTHNSSDSRTKSHETLPPSTKEHQHQRIIEQVEELKRLEKLEQQVHLLRATNSGHGSAFGSDLCPSGKSSNHSSYGHSQSQSSREDQARAVGRIMASVDQLPSLTIQSYNSQNSTHSHGSRTSTPGHTSSSSGGNVSMGAIQAPPAAVERLLTKVEQLRELESIKSSVDRIRAERGRAMSSTKSKADGES